MGGIMQTLSRQRTRIFLVNLLYFAALLGIGVLIFLMNLGGAVYLLAAVCVVCYLVLLRPFSRRYVGQVREEILRRTVGQNLENYCYEPKSGVTAEQVQASGLIAATQPKAFFSREHVTGSLGGIEIELADVSFPILENKLNAMFNGCYGRLRCPGASLPEILVKGGRCAQTELPAGEKKLLEQACSYIPGSLYLRTQGDEMEILVRGRFLGFRINPLMQLTESTLNASPLPELKPLLELLRRMVRNGKKEG